MVDLGIFQFAVDLAPVQAFAHDHPIYYGMAAFAAGSMLPRLWLKFLTSWLPAGTIRVIKFLRARGLTTEQLEEIDKAIEVIDREIDAEVAREKASAAGKGNAPSEGPATPGAAPAPPLVD